MCVSSIFSFLLFLSWIYLFCWHKPHNRVDTQKLVLLISTRGDLGKKTKKEVGGAEEIRFIRERVSREKRKKNFPSLMVSLVV